MKVLSIAGGEISASSALAVDSLSIGGQDSAGLYAPRLSGEPNGFENRNDVTFAWDNPTRTLTLSGTFVIWSDGNRYEISSPVAFQISASEGGHYIYFNAAGQLAEYTETFNTNLIYRYCYVMSAYWDATNSQAVPWPINETHGISMPSETHAYLHSTIGAQYISGMAITLNATGNGSADSHCQFTSSAGEMRDEDIPHTILAKSALTNTMRTLYRSGASGLWRMGAASAFPIITTGSGRAAYNQFTGGAWQLTEVGNNNYVLSHIYAMPGTDNQEGALIAVIGQAVYSTVTSARNGAYTEANTLQLTGLPTPEFKLIASLIVKTSNTYSNTVKSAFVETDTGGAYVDWRTAKPLSTSATAASAWGTITGTLSAQTDLQAALNGIIASMTTTQRDGLSAPTAGRIIFNTTTSTLQVYNGVAWVESQPLDATLTAVAGVTTAADKIVYFSGVDAAAAATLTSFGRSLIDDADAAAARGTMGLDTDDSVTFGLIQTTQKTPITTNQTSYPSATFFYNYAPISTGVTQSGQHRCLSAVAYRNSLAVDTDDSGTLATMYGILAAFGHTNTNPTATPQTTTAYGINITFQNRAGTVGTMYGLYVGTGNHEGTTTNRWGVYIQDAVAKNHIAGQTGIGTATPNASAKLDVSSTSQAVLITRHTSTQETSITGVAGLITYNSTLNKFRVFENNRWVNFAPIVAAPASAAAAGVAGDVAYDASYFYVCTATNTWRRVALTTW